MRLGGPIFVDEKADFEAQAKENARKGYKAAYCPLGVSLDDSRGVAQAVAAYKKEDVVIAEVGVWRNLLDPDPVKAKDAFDYCVTRLALGDALGARCVVNVLGSKNNVTHWVGAHESGYSDDFFAWSVETYRKVIDAVKPTRTKMTFEMMPYQFLDSPAEYRRLLKAIDRKGAGVHLDICNCMCSPRRYYDSAAFIEDVFKELGREVLSCHIKDIKMYDEGSVVQFHEVLAGEGGFDLKRYVDCARRYGDADLPLMLEHLETEAQYDKAFKYVSGL